MFCYDQVGAEASANLFSLVMRARANGAEPFEYLSYLFEHLPTAVSVEALEALLPWHRARPRSPVGHRAGRPRRRPTPLPPMNPGARSHIVRS
jgi:IS66 C-terminal element